MLLTRKNRCLLAILSLIIVAVSLLCLAPRLVLAQELKAEADFKPWSGWWWPKSHGELVLGYNGKPAPAEKYDLYVTGRRPGPAYNKGLQEWYDPNAEGWEGMCNGWVNAAILESGPILGASANGVFLNVGDKKGLLTACHFKDEINYKDCSNNPEYFHRYLLKYIGEQGECIGSDLDSSGSFWSYPIYSYDMTISSGLESDYVVCKIEYPTDFVDPDYQGSLMRTETYRYRLYKDAEGSITGGDWLAESVENHPQWVWVPVGINQDELFIDYETVREMAQTIDDELEGQELVPGHHLLMVYPGEDDSFKITPRMGENITCHIALDPQSVKGNTARYRLERNQETVAAVELGNELQPLSLISETGTDAFQLTFLPGENNSAGVCIHLYVEIEAQYQSWFYGFPPENFWLGCAAAGLNETAGARFWLEIAGDQGLPVGSGQVSGADLNPGGHWLSVLENNLTEDYFSGNGKPIGFKLLSSTPFQGMLLAGDGRTLWGPPQSYEVSGSKLVIPWLTSAWDMHKSANFHLANANINPVKATISYFKQDGTPLPPADVELAPKTTVAYNRGNYPGQRGVDGWGLVEGSGTAQFSGGVDLREGFKRMDQLPLLKSGRNLIAAHLVTSFGWQTLLGVCNPNPESLNLLLTPFVDGDQLGMPYPLEIDPFAKHEMVIEGSLFGLSQEEMDKAWIRIDGDRDSAAYLRYLYQNDAGASIPLAAEVEAGKLHKLAQIAISDGWWTGIVLLNHQAAAVSVEITALNAEGEELQRLPVELGPYAKFSTSVAAAFSSVKPEDLAQLRLDGAGSAAIKAQAFYGGINGVTFLAVHNW